MQLKEMKFVWAITVMASLVACGGSDDKPNTLVATEGPVAQQVNNCERCSLSEWQPLPAAIEVSPEVQLARDSILGPNATDPSTVKLWWFGVSSFVASIGGHLLLLDAWETVGLHQDYVPIAVSYTHLTLPTIYSV